ncbi:hypothetical protein PLANPX_2769 [Lacipirellula parvula]|uniref:Uncharacterized protein n=1 Tax=Lacipirellula parvula TaxID=2650471 RepID=A0A5K7XAZ0_9BACT|nr:hypothetical protein PLANPX_2769 [Lacipirellula parvula]
MSHGASATVGEADQACGRRSAQNAEYNADALAAKETKSGSRSSE